MTISSTFDNRPVKLGAKNRREYIVCEGELTIRAQNDASGNALFIGKAIAGTLESVEKWQISEQTYDGSDALLTKKWPENAEGNASTNYEFEWDERGSLTFV